MTHQTSLDLTAETDIPPPDAFWCVYQRRCGPGWMAGCSSRFDVTQDALVERRLGSAFDQARRVALRLADVESSWDVRNVRLVGGTLGTGSWNPFEGFTVVERF